MALADILYAGNSAPRPPSYTGPLTEPPVSGPIFSKGA